MGPFDVALLATIIGVTTPILLAASGELISERAGVLNVGLEGMMLGGAFVAFLVAYELHSMVLGVLAGVAAGLAFAVIMAALAVEAKADQIVVGIGINVLAVGITGFAFDEIFSDRAAARVHTMDKVALPGLSSLGGVGDALFNQPLLIYVAFLVIPAVWVLLYRTRWGLSIRSVGELPVAADTAGVNVRATRWLATMTAGALAGLGGAYLSLVDLGLFRQEMSAGRGFLALAAVIFGRWRPRGVLLACLLFGSADALQLRLQAGGSVPAEIWLLIAGVAAAYLLRRLAVARRVMPVAVAGAICAAAIALAVSSPQISLPNQLWLALPFLLALAALAGAAARVRMPAALTLPYRRGEA
jgi:simple sugar transport system permease protein